MAGAEAHLTGQERRYAEIALRACEKLLNEKDPATSYEPIAEVARCVIRLRDHLIDKQRSGEALQPDRLPRVNSLVSLASSAEYPLVGVRWNRVCMVRDVLKDLLEGKTQESAD